MQPGTCCTRAQCCSKAGTCNVNTNTYVSKFNNVIWAGTVGPGAKLGRAFNCIAVRPVRHFWGQGWPVTAWWLALAVDPTVPVCLAIIRDCL